MHKLRRACVCVLIIVSSIEIQYVQANKEHSISILALRALEGLDQFRDNELPDLDILSDEKTLQKK